MLSNPLQDEDRFRGYINEAIKDGEVEAYDAYTKETKKSINQRHAKARREEHEAKEHAKKLGKYDSIFGDGDKKPNKKIKNDNDSDLAELIQQRANGRADVLLNHLEAKYAGGKNGSAKGRNGKKRKAEEPPEELFQKNRQKGEKKQKADRKEMDEEEEVDLDDDSHVSEDEEVEVNVNPVKAKKRGVTTKKGTTTKK